MGLSGQSLDPLPYVEHGGDIVVYVDTTCSFSKIAAQHIAENPIDKEIVIVPVGNLTLDEELNLQWCRNAFRKSTSWRIDIANLFRGEYDACNLLSNRAYSAMQQSYDQSGTPDGLPAWKVGNKWIGAGVSPEMLSLVGLPPISYKK